MVALVALDGRVQDVVLQLDAVGLGLDAVDAVVERVDDAAVDDAGADHDAEREREEDADQRHDVEPEVDHQLPKMSFIVTQKPRMNTWMGSATIPTTTIASTAAPMRSKMSRRRTRPW